MTLENLDKNLNFIRERIFEESKPFEKSLLPEDFKDLMSDSLFKVLNYLPKEFDSELHYRNWSKLFCFRFVSNTFREMKTAKLTRSFSNSELVQDSDYPLSMKEYFSKMNLEDAIFNLTNNSGEKIDKLLNTIKKYARERSVHIYLEYLKFIKNKDGRSVKSISCASEIAEKYGVTRKSVFNICRKFNKALSETNQ
jgi:hypothetical protein